MTLTAVHKVTLEPLNISTYKIPKEEIPDWDEYLCPISGKPVTPVIQHQRKRGDRTMSVRCHWKIIGVREWPQDVIFDPEYAYKVSEKEFNFRETPFHTDAKIFVQNNIELFDPFASSSMCVCEHKIYIPHKNKYRIGDVVCIYDKDQKNVFEIQTSPITPQDFKERTIDYLNGEKVASIYWVFRQKALSREVYEAHLDILGVRPGLLNIEESLQYIEEDTLQI